MKQSQLNRITNIMNGINRARTDLSGPAPVELACDVLCDNLWSDPPILTSEEAAYLACMMIAWQDAGCPPLE